MDKICYKVVVREYGSNTYNCFLSTSYSSNPYSRNPYFLYYFLKDVTYPKIGKIFVFDTLENAEKFSNDKEVILKGIAENVSFPKYICIRFGDIEKFWKNKRAKKSVSAISHKIYKGTLWCDSFTPLEIA